VEKELVMLLGQLTRAAILLVTVKSTLIYDRFKKRKEVLGFGEDNVNVDGESAGLSEQ